MVAAVFVLERGMNMKSMKKILAIIMVLAMVLSMTACISTEAPDEPELITVKDGETIGEGAAEFALEIIDAEGTQVNVTVKTDETTVGGALVELGLIAGEPSEYGLYMKTVNGITYDYDKDGKYWAFYVDGTYATLGVDLTDIEAGVVYTLKAE